MGATGKIDQAAVLARWRETRSPRLADLLCCVPVDDGWVARLEEISSYNDSYSKRAIADLPDDPRTTVFLVERLEKPGVWWGPGAKSRERWELVFERLAKLRDARCVPLLRALVVTPPRFFQPKFTRWIVSEIERVADTLDRLKIPKDDARTRKLAEAQTVVPPKGGFFARASSLDRDALLERVWAAPDDMELRSVIGDALQEIGDPRGELIAMMASDRADNETVRDFVYEHRVTLAGPIERIVSNQTRDLSYVAGFLDACRVGTFGGTLRDWEEAATSPLWATITHVELTSPIKRKWLQAWWSANRLVSLRKITCFEVTLVRDRADTPWRLEKVPRQLREIALQYLELLFSTMPRAELQRIAPPPESHPVGQLLRKLAARKQRV